MKSYDLDLLQKQTKKKRNSPMLMPAEVIRRAERFKYSIAITPLPDACHLRRVTRGAQPCHIPEPEGNTRALAAALANPCPLQRAAERQRQGPSCWGCRRTCFSQQRFFHPCLPIHLTTTTASALYPSTWPLTTSVLPPADVPARNVLPHSKLPLLSMAADFWNLKCLCAKYCYFSKASSTASLSSLPQEQPRVHPNPKSPFCTNAVVILPGPVIGNDRHSADHLHQRSLNWKISAQTA